jgi:hypothetical protein
METICHDGFERTLKRVVGLRSHWRETGVRVELRRAALTIPHRKARAIPFGVPIGDSPNSRRSTGEAFSPSRRDMNRLMPSLPTIADRVCSSELIARISRVQDMRFNAYFVGAAMLALARVDESQAVPLLTNGDFET